MKVFATLPQADLNDIPEATRRIEADGYDGIVALENRHDPFLPLAVAAVHSQKLELATGVAIAFPRSPMNAANIGWDLQQAALAVSNWAWEARFVATMSVDLASSGRLLLHECGNTLNR